MVRLNCQMVKRFSLQMPVPIWGTINDSVFVCFSEHNINIVTNVLIPNMCKLLDQNFRQYKKMT